VLLRVAERNRGPVNREIRIEGMQIAISRGETLSQSAFSPEQEDDHETQLP